jgi:hypothetical protein
MAGSRAEAACGNRASRSFADSSLGLLGRAKARRVSTLPVAEGTLVANSRTYS